MILRPTISEKAIILADEENTYAFYVPKDATKISIAKAVSDRYDVEVETVRTKIHKGKSKRTLVQRGRKFVNGDRSDLKQAYVRVKEGDSIKLFEGSE
ncbi:MAG: 50S ribosomal protein L23 [Candidatus Saccharimonadales bacterium]